MKRRPEKLFLVFLRFLNWALCLGIFLLVMSRNTPYLLVASRTTAIVMLSFTMNYYLMARVYGGMDVGARKAKPIILSMGLVVLISDLVAHLFLCIMNYTIIHDSHFVYESPGLLFLSFVIQMAVIIALSYFGNDLYFTMRKPQRCLIVVHRYDDYEEFVAKVARFSKQFKVERIAFVGDQEIPRYVSEADAVFIYNLVEAERIEIIQQCYRDRKDIFYSMELTDVVAIGASQVRFDDSTMLASPSETMSMEEQAVKRLFDIVVSGLGLLVLSPLFLIVAIAIKLEDGGPVFYHQKRATFEGKAFEILKFRSMHPEVGEDHHSVTDDDDRITRVGAVIRKLRIDELPQLWNVLRGDMSIVGPRPEMLENVEKYTEELPEFAYRLRAKAGLTGMAQVYGKYNTSPKDKMIMDLVYIETYSFWLDLKLILRTILVLLTPEHSTEAFRKKEKK